MPYIVKCSKCDKAMPRPTKRPFICYYCKPKSYTRTYYRNRKLAFKRDNYQCQSCKTKNKIIIHHIDCNIKNNSMSNLITLCNQCHHSLHGNYTNKQLREGNIYKMFAKEFRWGQFGKRPIYGS